MKKLVDRIINSTVFFVIFLIFLILARLFVFVPVTVLGDSMEPTLVSGERGIAVTVGKPSRFDIVTFPAPDEENRSYIKRVIGMPGDTVEYRQDVLYINGKTYKEPYLDEFKSKLLDNQPLTWDFSLAELYGVDKVPAGHYFVMGDNRRISKDSRYIGFIDGKDIQGDLKFTFWPFNKFGLVE